MPISAAEAKSLLGQTTQTAVPAISPEEARSLLASSVPQQPGISVDESRIMGVLNQNSDKNFVQRILKPEGKPTLDLGGDNFATHEMAWGTADGKSIVYPEVIQDPKTGQLKKLSTKDAMDHAVKTKQFITAKDNADAAWLSSNYKKVWDMEGKNISLKKELSTPQQQPIDLLARQDAQQTDALQVGSKSLSQVLSGTPLRFRKPEEAIQEAGGIAPYLHAVRSNLRAAAGGIGAAGAGGAQETARIGKNIFGTLPTHRFNLPPSRTLQLLNLLPKKSQEIQQQLIQQHPQQARVGRILGNIATYGGLGEAIAPAEAISDIARPALKFGAKGLSFLKGAGKFIRPKLVAKGIVENLPKAKSAESVLNELGSGKSLNENAQNIAAKIKKVGTTKLKESGERFEDINKRAGVNSMYPEGEPVSKNSYKALEKWKRPPMMHYTDTLKDAHEDFMDIPTFDKAHKLQSTLGSVANRTLKNPASNMQQIDVAGRFSMAQDRLLNDMHSHLNKIDPSKQLSTEYDGARKLHALDAIPYKDNKQIHEIVKGKVQNPRNLTTIFKNPESNTLKIVKNLGSGAKDQIVYNELRATAGKNPTAEKLIKAYSGLEKKGLNSYVSPKLDQQMENLKQTQAQEEFSKQIGAKPNVERILKASDKLEDKGLLPSLPASLRNQLDILRSTARRSKFIKRGAGIAGLGLLAKEFLPSHITKELL